MVEFQTVAVYSIITIVMLYFARKSAATNNFMYMVIGILFYSVIMGLRYNVGVDCSSYVQIFEWIQSGGHVDKELGFTSLMKLLSVLGFNSSACLGFMAFFQLFFVFKIFENRKEIFPFLVFTYMLGGEWLVYCNIVRHIMAFALTVYSLKFIQSKEILKHYAILVAAIFLHKSAAIMLIVYPLYLIKDEYFKNIKLQYLLLGFSLIIMNLDLVQEFVKQADIIMQLLGYAEKYSYDERMDQEFSLGAGFLIELMINILIIYNSNKIKEAYRDSLPVCVMHDFFVAGIVLKYCFIGSMLIQRLNIFFVEYTIVLAAVDLAYLVKSRMKQKYIYYGLYALLAFAVLYRMYDNSALFVFNFQNEWFYLKRDFDTTHIMTW